MRAAIPLAKGEEQYNNNLFKRTRFRAYAPLKREGHRIIICPTKKKAAELR